MLKNNNSITLNKVEYDNLLEELKTLRNFKKNIINNSWNKKIYIENKKNIINNFNNNITNYYNNLFDFCEIFMKFCSKRGFSVNLCGGKIRRFFEWSDKCFTEEDFTNQKNNRINSDCDFYITDLNNAPIGVKNLITLINDLIDFNIFKLTNIPVPLTNINNTVHFQKINIKFRNLSIRVDIFDEIPNTGLYGNCADFDVNNLILDLNCIKLRNICYPHGIYTKDLTSIQIMRILLNIKNRKAVPMFSNKIIIGNNKNLYFLLNKLDMRISKMKNIGYKINIETSKHNLKKGDSCFICSNILKEDQNDIINLCECESCKLMCKDCVNLQINKIGKLRQQDDTGVTETRYDVCFFCKQKVSYNFKFKTKKDLNIFNKLLIKNAKLCESNINPPNYEY